MMLVSGVGYASGTAKSMVTEAIGKHGLQSWGVSMMFTGGLLIVATAIARPTLEKLALRILSCDLFAYIGWVLAVIPFNRAASTVFLGGSLIALSEFRVWHLGALIKRTAIIRHELKQREP